ncbi:MAG: BlaI/MecI/CopY family transcriptional regulator [Lachnospira sp.]|nr:BlaI/MecI/CopY family transcriptional regulator [Lachnospira sp.]
MGELTPSENEWQIMEVIWKAGRPVTASEVIEQVADRMDITKKTIRVMLNRLVAKGVIDYTLDKKDARIYHYFPLRSREECIRIKSNRFLKHYFSGRSALAVASFLKEGEVSEEELEELSRMVEQMKKKK